MSEESLSTTDDAPMNPLHEAWRLKLPGLLNYLNSFMNAVACELCGTANWIVVGDVNSIHFAMFEAFVAKKSETGTDMDKVGVSYPAIALSCGRCGNTKHMMASIVLDRMIKSATLEAGQ